VTNNGVIINGSPSLAARQRAESVEVTHEVFFVTLRVLGALPETSCRDSVSSIASAAFVTSNWPAK
jgi:hypothetical protein